MTGALSPSPWPLLASGWEELFPLRQPRLDLALRLTQPGDLCLDAGCATGALPRALAAQGRQAQGLDLDASFLEVARGLARVMGLGITYHRASLLELASAVAGARFQLITCLGQTLPHLLEDEDWLSFFTQAREALAPGGHLVIQAVNDATRPVGETRDLPGLRCTQGSLLRRRTMLSPTLARFETVFHPDPGEPVASGVTHRRMSPQGAAALLRRAGLVPEPPLADEGGKPFQESSPGWVLIAQRPTRD